MKSLLTLPIIFLTLLPSVNYGAFAGEYPDGGSRRDMTRNLFAFLQEECKKEDVQKYRAQFDEQKSFTEIRNNQVVSIANSVNIKNSKIFVYALGGLGDTATFYSAINFMFKELGASVTLAVQPPIKKTIENSRAIDKRITVVGKNELIPPHDYHCSLFEAMLLNVDEEGRLVTHPLSAPCFTPSELLINRMAERMQFSKNNFNVGIIFQGAKYTNQKYQKTAEARSIKLERLAAALFALRDQIPNLVCYNLQAGEQDQIDALDKTQYPLRLIPNLDKESGAFEETMAVGKLCNLAVCVDTGGAHFIGETGTHVALLLAPMQTKYVERLRQEFQSKHYAPKAAGFSQQEIAHWGEESKGSPSLDEEINAKIAEGGFCDWRWERDTEIGGSRLAPNYTLCVQQVPGEWDSSDTPSPALTKMQQLILDLAR